MADFRRLMTALALVALFAGLACAQATVPASMSCTTTSTVTPLVRPEGLTEQTGDVVLACTGGTVLAAGAQIPQANITVFLSQPVTSRIMGNAGNASEALLLIDEPGALPPVTGYGTTLPQTVCPTPLSGCTEYVGTSGGTPGVPVQGPTSTAAGWNVFQGVVSGNQVTFYGVPILPPASSGVTRVYRMTNIRTNAAGLGGAASGTAITANVSISPSNAFTINQSQLNVAYLGNVTSYSLRNTANTADTSSSTTLPQCNSISVPSGPGSNVLGLRFTPGFPTAFKTRVAVGVNGNTSPTAAVNTQNIPGQVYNSESGFTLNVNPAGNSAPSTTVTAGLADWGTRLKATFNNIPSGVSIFVSATNFVPSSSSTFATSASAPFAQAVISETVPDANGSLAFASTVSKPAGYIQVPITNGTGIAVWEVLNANYTTLQDYEFGVIASFSANVANNSPATGPMTVNMSLAPNPTNGAFTASQGADPTKVNIIPRFIDNSTARTFANVNLCQTVLLFPYVTTASGFDTGVAISNTTQDPFGTGAQSGSCALNWYQAGTAGTNPPVTTTPTVPSGTTYTTLASTPTNAGTTPPFTGYMIAVCNFQLGHGYAAITDVGARGIFSSYLALVIPGTGSRSGTESLGN